MKSAAIGVALATLISCGGGGGGGGGGGDTALQYSGNTSAAVITTGNAAALTANIAGTSDVAKATSSIAPSDEAASANGADLNRGLTRAFRSALGKLTSGDGGLPRSRLIAAPCPAITVAPYEWLATWIPYPGGAYRYLYKLSGRSGCAERPGDDADRRCCDRRSLHSHRLRSPSPG